MDQWMEMEWMDRWMEIGHLHPSITPDGPSIPSPSIFVEWTGMDHGYGPWGMAFVEWMELMDMKWMEVHEYADGFMEVSHGSMKMFHGDVAWRCSISTMEMVHGDGDGPMEMFHGSMEMFYGGVPWRLPMNGDVHWIHRDVP